MISKKIIFNTFSSSAFLLTFILFQNTIIAQERDIYMGAPITMGLTAMVPFGIHLFILSDSPIDLWLSKIID